MLRSPRPYQDTKLLCLSTFENVKRTYKRETQEGERERVLRLVGHLKRLISCTVVVLFGDVRESLTECVLVTDVHVHRTLLQNHSVIL